MKFLTIHFMIIPIPVSAVLAAHEPSNGRKIHEPADGGGKIKNNENVVSINDRVINPIFTANFILSS
jgi:hypothetical protein